MANPRLLPVEGAPGEREHLSGMPGKFAGQPAAPTQLLEGTLVLVPGINHLLVSAKTGELAEYGSLAGEKVSPLVATQIADWLKQLPR